MNEQAQRELEAGPGAAARPPAEAARPAGPAAAGALDPAAAALRLRCGPVEREVVLKLIDGLKAL